MTMFPRECGILFPVFSLPSRFGIGCFSDEAYRFIDFLKKSGQSYWQVLPFGPTGYGDSPYQPFSAFAGNPYFIDPETLIREGLLTWEECNQVDFGSDMLRVDYGKQYMGRLDLLRKAYQRYLEQTVKTENGSEQEQTEPEDNGKRFASFEEFKQANASWLNDYALFMALKDEHEQKSWMEWEDPIRLRKPAALKAARIRLKDQIAFYIFVQWKFREQWDKLHAYAGEQGISIIGDIPFYLAMDSVDTWSHPEAFCFDKDLKPVSQAGCPPDVFSATGQLWGNPIYDWKNEKKNHYAWWISRIQSARDLFDVIRIDHFHGFAEYYEIPYEAKDALSGVMKEGPGMDFFDAMKKELGEVPIIAEDLGTITPVNEKLLKDSGYPGMKILQFAFDGSEASWYLPYNHIRNCVVYTGTHDNTTLLAWVEDTCDHDRDFARRYINSENTSYGAFVWDLIREAYRSAADTCIIPLQDYLVKGREARINSPGTQGNNWQWRLEPNFLSDDLSRSIYKLAQLYGRLPK